MKPIESPTTEEAGEPVAWALKGRSGSIREVTDDKDAIVNWHPDFIVPLYERPAGDEASETTYHECMVSLLDRTEAAEADAFRYRFLRDRMLDAVEKGGVFAGKTPDNVVLNGEDLVKAIDAESGVAFVTPPVITQNLTDEQREAFEKWWTRSKSGDEQRASIDLMRESIDHEGEYSHLRVQTAWEAWHASALLARTETK